MEKSMNELALIVDGEIMGVDRFVSRFDEAKKSIGLLKPTASNSALCAAKVTEHNKMLKAGKNALLEAQKQFLRPFVEALAPATEAVNVYEELFKAEQTEVLNAKKEKAKEEAYQEFLNLAQLSKDGNVPDWGSFYEPSWYSLTKEQVRSAMVSKLAKFGKAEEPDNPNAVAVFTVIGSKDISKVESFMKANLINFQKEGI